MGPRVGIIGLSFIGLPIAEPVAAAGVPSGGTRRTPRACCHAPRGTSAKLSLCSRSRGFERHRHQPRAGREADRGGVVRARRRRANVGQRQAVRDRFDARPQPVQRFAGALLERGCEMLDMPISGGYAADRSGELSLMIGANAGVLKRAQLVLGTFAKVITPASPRGTRLANRGRWHCNRTRRSQALRSAAR